MHGVHSMEKTHPTLSQAEPIMYNEKKTLNKREINVLPILSES